jgi:hypothetical protein
MFRVHGPNAWPTAQQIRKLKNSESYEGDCFDRFIKRLISCIPKHSMRQSHSTVSLSSEENIAEEGQFVGNNHQ